MDIEIKIDGIKELERNLNKVYESMIKGANKGIKDVAENIQSVSRDKAPTDGRNILKNSIFVSETKEKALNMYEIYVDTIACPWAWYVYFGTGVRGQGKKKLYWWVGESKLENSTPELMDSAGFYKKLNEETGEYMWKVYGQRPKPFMNEAIEETMNQNRDIISRAIRNEIRKGM